MVAAHFSSANSLSHASIKASLLARFDLDPQSSKVLVVGLGDTGVSVAYYLQRMGVNFALTDTRQTPPVKDTFYQDMADVPIFTGGFDENAFQVATHLVVSPGISLDEEAISEASKRGAKILSDIDLFACSIQAPILGITGSNGKSTVTTMLGEMAIAAGKHAVIGGNIGIPVLDLLNNTSENDSTRVELYILELSSFQLERTSALNAIAATVLNVTADHLDRHADMATYAQEKERIFDGDGCMIINIDDPVVNAMKKEARKTLTFSIEEKADFYLGKAENQCEYLFHNDHILMPLAELPIEGRHNAANALAALALGVAAGLDEQAMCKALKNFTGLEHRMQKVAEINGVTWINDSKATNIGACKAALQGSERKVVLIAGGDAKGADMNELTPVIRAKTKSVILIGKDAKLIEAAIEGCVPVYFAGTMAQAVKTAASLAQTGESVLLSPACASLDQYTSYRERGDKFKQAVLELAL
jgi:UDP-N-acetylmuramoylalanine--D-glutamate ligase